MRLTPFTLFAFVAALPVRAQADENKHLCCTLNNGGGCVAQPGPCATSSSFGVDLADLTQVDLPGGGCDTYYGDPDAGDITTGPCSDVSLTAYATGASFPDGTDGHFAWTSAPPWSGLCLVAPNPSDPMHDDPTEPIGCVAVTVGPGIGAEVATYDVPVDGRWDAFQRCYGSPTNDPLQGSCASVDDLNDPSVQPSPTSGSCCEPPQLLTPPDLAAPGEWGIVFGGGELPGIPPSQVIYGPDGGPVAFEIDGGDTIGSVPDACSSAFLESPNCGEPLDASVFPDAGDPPATPPAAPTVDTGSSCSTTLPGAPSNSWGYGVFFGMLIALRRRWSRSSMSGHRTF